jgi:TP901 family phage tail tape measure protein
MPQDGGSIYSEIRIELDKLKADLKKSDDAFNKFAKENEKDSKKVQGNWTTAFTKLNLAGVVAITAVTLAFKKAVTTFAQTEQSLANVRAVTGASAADFAKLKDAADEAGETTRFSASQAADALYNLGSAGFDAQQSIDSLNGVLLLAGATGSDLGSTSATLTAAISQFGLEASDATKISNVFAAAIGNSQANMEKLSSAFRQVGPIAGTLGISIEETTASLQALFNAGLQGEQAGTALRSVLLDLADSTSPVIDKLAAYGVSFDEVNPKTVGLTKAVEVLATSGADLGAVFGKVAAAGILTLAETSQKADGNLRDLEAAVTGTNAAAEQYAIQNDTLAGSIDSFRSKLEAFSNTIIGLISPSLRGLIDLGGQLLSFVNNAIKATQSQKDLNDSLKTVQGALTGIKADIPKLAEEYNTLAEKENLSNKESLRKEEITNRLLDLIPNLTTENLNNATSLIALAGAQDEYNKRILAEEKLVLIKNLRELNKERERSKKTLIDLIVKQSNVTNGLSQLERNNLLAQEDGEKLLAAAKAEEEERVRTLTKALQDETDIKKLNELANVNAGTSVENLVPQYQELEEEVTFLTDLLDETNDQLKKLGGETLDTSAAWDEFLQKVIEVKDNLDESNDLYISEIATTKALAAEQSKLREEQNAFADGYENKQRQQEENRNRRAKEEADRERALRDQLSAFREGYDNKARQIELNRQKRQEEQAAAELEREKNITEGQEEFRRGYADKAIQIAANQRRREIEELEEAERREKEILNQQLEFRRGYAEKQFQIEVNKRKRAIEQEEIRQKAIEDLEQQVQENQEASVEAFIEGIKAETAALRKEAAEQEAIVKETEDAKQDLYKSTFDAVLSFSETILNVQLARIEKELQAELEAAGLSEQTELEKLQTKLQKAIDAGDTETQNELKQEIERQKIKEKYAKEAAELQLKAFKFNKALLISRAVIDTAAAIIKFLADPGGPAGVILSAAAGLTGAAQIAQIASQQPPAFETGGIVIGNGSASGQTIRVAEGGTSELMLNNGPAGDAMMNEFANRIADKINSALQVTGGTINLDGRSIAENSAAYYNKGIVRLNK